MMALAWLWMMPASAQSSAQTASASEEIVVTAQFRDKASAGSAKLDLPLVNTPQAISIVSKDVISALELQEVSEASRYVAGVTFDGPVNSAEGGGLSSRGYAVTNLKINGVNTAFRTLDPILLDRAEFVKGANSISYGAAGPGGFLNFITRRPTSDFRAEVSAAGGTYGYRRIGGSVSGSISDNVRVVVAGTLNRTNADYRGQDLRRPAAYVSGEFQATPTTSISVRAIYQKIKSQGTTGLPFFNFDGDAINVQDTINFFKSRRRRSEPTQDWDLYTAHSTVLQAEVSQRLGDRWTFGVLLSYEKEFDFNADSYVCCSDGRPFVGGYGGANHNTTKYAEARLTGSFELFGREQKLSVFSEYSKLRGRRKELTESDTIDLTFNDLNQRVPDLYPDGYSFVSESFSSTRYAAVAANLLLSVAKPIDIILGGRYDDYRLKQRTVSYFNNADGAQLVSPDLAGHKFTPRAAIIAKPIKHVSFYYSYSKSFNYNSARFCPYDANGQPQSSGSFPPLSGKQDEVGAKAELMGGKLLLTSALFKIKQRNEAIFDFNCFDANGNPDDGSIAAGVSKSRGIEFEAVGKITSHLDIIASYSRIRKSFPFFDFTYSFDTFAVFAKYDVPRLDGFSFGLGSRYVDRKPVTIPTTSFLLRGLIIDSALYYSRGNYSMALNARNVFNKRLFQSSFGSLEYGIREEPPRTLDLTATIRF